MDSVLCAYSSKVVNHLNDITWLPKIDEIISIQITTRDSLDKSIWQVVGYAEPLSVDNYFDIKSLRETKYIGADIRGSGGINKLLTAYHGLGYWDANYDPEYFDKLLLPQIIRPPNVLFKPA